MLQLTKCSTEKVKFVCNQQQVIFKPHLSKTFEEFYNALLHIATIIALLMVTTNLVLSVRN
jgi:hypothetical protein